MTDAGCGWNRGWSGDSCKRVGKLVANDSSVFKNGYFGGKVEGISTGENGGRGARKENQGSLFEECRCGVPGMLGGRELGATISGS